MTPLVIRKMIVGDAKTWSIMLTALESHNRTIVETVNFLYGLKFPARPEQSILKGNIYSLPAPL